MAYFERGDISPFVGGREQQKIIGPFVLNIGPHDHVDAERCGAASRESLFHPLEILHHERAQEQILHGGNHLHVDDVEAHMLQVAEHLRLDAGEHGHNGHGARE